MSLQSSLDRLVAAEVGRRHCHEIAFGVLQGDRLVTSCAGSWRGRPVTAETPFLIASTSKLLITTMVFQLVSEGRLTLNDPVARYLPAELAGMHRWRGQDLSGQITVRQLLNHSSGLPDYFEGHRRVGGSLAKEVFADRDQAFGLAEVLRWAGEDMSPVFAPGTGRKAHYADTNFYLLTELVERLTGQDIGAALAARITDPLGLSGTAFFRPGMETLPLRLGDRVLEVPRALASMPGDGGAVSTVADLARFTSAFFAGRLFASPLLAELPDWRRVFFPLQAGTGVLRFHVPRWLPPFRAGLDFIGHSGISGAVAFACPAHRLIVVGTVNQLADRSRPYRLMIKAALAAVASAAS